MFPGAKRRTVMRKGESGMTLIEIIIVLALVGGLMGFVMSHVSAGNITAREKETEMAFGQLRSVMQMYKLHNNKFPTTEQGLRSLVENPGIQTWRGPYCEPQLLKDAWGTDIQLESDGRQLHFSSAGDDGEFGTEDDLAWPRQEAKASE